MDHAEKEKHKETMAIMMIHCVEVRAEKSAIIKKAP
tara:strand:- start:3484 stop:3591 length:108 start_codon:yes stop_codon:yes gene_type:complete